ncbi:hypothetical protein Y1Q_0010572 [Alligator mississippiensis]|uniref:Uncharacterized protein n=1 Tax=Alligator mississippiensis TaxID=8496 RepID=A0A151NLX5_ALLMI|nr:hypothetical protein Y1Q_0010572 [Alligator mississippiensis]
MCSTFGLNGVKVVNKQAVDEWIQYWGDNGVKDRHNLVLRCVSWSQELPELQVWGSQQNKLILLTPPESMRTTPARSKTSSPPQGWTRAMDRNLVPNSTNQKWDQQNRRLEELEKALVRLHGIEKLGVLRRKMKSWSTALCSQGFWIEKEQIAEQYFLDREQEWEEEQKWLLQQRPRLGRTLQRIVPQDMVAVTWGIWWNETSGL